MWEQVGTTGAIVISVLLMVFIAIAIAMVKGKKMVKQEEGVGSSEILKLGEVAEPRQETCFGCPPEGPDVALDLDPHRYDGYQCSNDRN
jgi:hypothetical protein